MTDVHTIPEDQEELDLTAAELATIAGGCTCEKFDDGSGGLTVKPH